MKRFLTVLFWCAVLVTIWGLWPAMTGFTSSVADAIWPARVAEREYAEASARLEANDKYIRTLQQLLVEAPIDARRRAEDRLVAAAFDQVSEDELEKDVSTRLDALSTQVDRLAQALDRAEKRRIALVLNQALAKARLAAFQDRSE